METNPSQDLQLNSDVVFEILSWTSLKTLANCRLVSKECNRLTYKSAFLNLHSRRTKTVSGFFLRTMKFNYTITPFVAVDNPNCSVISLGFLPSLATVEASSLQGILVCVDNTTQSPRYYVCKPTTKEWEQIPNPETRYLTTTMAIKVVKSNPLWYKIVRFSRPNKLFSEKYYRLRCEIFDSMVENWRQIGEVNLPYDEHIYSWNPAITACGNFHWLTSENRVFTFDVDVGKYCLFSLPFADRYDQVQLTNYDGKFAVICKDGSFFYLWVMENYWKTQWGERVRISTKFIEKESPVTFFDVDVALVPGFYSLLWYTFRNGFRINKVRFDSNYVMAKRVFPFQSDFEVCGLNLKNEIMLTRTQDDTSQIPPSQLSFSGNFTFVFVLLLVIFMPILICFVLDL